MAYSFIGFQTLYIATNWDPVFWNTACLIIDSDGIDLNEQMTCEDFEEESNSETEENEIEEDDEEEEEETKKKIQKTVDYGKMAIAIGKMQAAGITVTIPDINKSDLTFSPDPDNSQIIYGLKGIARINDDIVNEIIVHRPYSSLKDFEQKVKVNKIQMSNLIKCGAFDNIYKDKTREDIMIDYIESISDKKEKLTLQNMSKLISSGTLNEDYQFYKSLFNFNKYLKNLEQNNHYILDERAYNYFEKNFDLDHLESINGKASIKKNQWKKIYDANMESFKQELKNNKTILDIFNKKAFMEVWDKYGAGNISSWEMDSINFYYHDHELKGIDKKKYEIDNFFELSEEPEIASTFTTKDGTEIPILKIHRICGTIIDKDKNKNTLVLLTEEGVVNIKIYRAQFSKFDRQISVKDPITGKKTIVEKSWFSRGNKLLLTGFRRGDTFVPKVYKNSAYPYAIELILSMDEQGNIEFAGERME